MMVGVMKRSQLEQVLKIEHRSSPRLIEMAILLPLA